MAQGIPRLDRDSTVLDYIPGQLIPVLIRDPNTGKLYLNPLKKYVQPFTLVIEPASVVVAAGDLSLPIPMTLDAKGPFEVFSASYYSSRAEGFTVQIMNPDERPLLMNREIHVDTLAGGGGATTVIEGALAAQGSGGRPYRWPETFWLNGQENGKCIQCVFRNLSAYANTIRFALHGLRWYYMQAPQKVSDRMYQIYQNRSRTMPYFHTTEQYVSLAAGLPLTTQEYEVRFGDECWTEMKKLTAISTGLFNVRISEKSTGRSLTGGNYIRSDLVFGAGELPFLLWESALFEPGTKLVLDFQNVNYLTTNVIWPTLGCRKIMSDPREDSVAARLARY